MSGGAVRMPGWLRWCVLALLVVLTQPAWAVRCIADGGGTMLTESIGNVASYPTDAPDGYVIWVSPPRTTTGYCYKDLGGDMKTFGEWIYFYANPEKQNPAAWGLEIGIRYLGQDYFGRSSQPGDGVKTNTYVDPCDLSDAEVKAGYCRKFPLSITYQVVVRKRGTWVQPPSDIYAVFQFDGKGGLNYINPSFRYKLSGLQKLKPTPCTVDVLVTPEPGIVNFGQVQTSGNGFLPAVPRKRFSMSLTKKCSIPVRVDGYFEATKGTVQNGLLVPESKSNFGIGLEDSQGKPIEFNKQFTLTQFPANVANQSVMLDAVLKSFGPPKIGPFNASATIRIFLY
ncbi:fimbrial protein [Burkholderia ubonensis]|uniref:fimbrial protein n=1 Tax=Burkholderia ubonensis TaxID=101571 RepID=UPI0007523678|nr:fimbrial protein [Burkholderia ubonensis]KVG75017.1 fimbrial protein [Burkholderia ubonensis]KVH19784.1 fimbrial protein [Burkholderia ubonensis]KVH50153.1 fimbrial protein [Burkholderia ubonensis]KVH87206.1 fimbrial protein [Burkholderia ubonensis]KVM37615.1 fimbrial protein [Burkholderia ubonensis]